MLSTNKRDTNKCQQSTVKEQNMALTVSEWPSRIDTNGAVMAGTQLFTDLAGQRWSLWSPREDHALYGRI